MPPAGGARRAEDLGINALSQLVGGTRAVIMLIDAQRRIVFANAAACRLLAQRWSELRGRDLLDLLFVDERARLAPYVNPRTVNSGATFTCTLSDVDGLEQQMVGSAVAIDAEGRPLIAVILWDQSDAHVAARKGAAVAQMPTQFGTASVADVLMRVARHAVEGTRATGCSIVVVDDEHGYDSGAYAPGEAGTEFGVALSRNIAAGHPIDEWVEAMTAGYIRVGCRAEKALLLPRAAELWSAHPATSDHVSRLSGLTFGAAIGVPVAWRGRVVGLCTLYLPPNVSVVTKSELAFIDAFGDQVALAVMHARLYARASEAAASSERARLSQHLHDSASQSLFAITMYARAAQLAAGSANLDPTSALSHSLNEIAQLSRDASAEMRALIFQLRPQGLSEEGLAAALHHQAVALSAREGFAVTLDAPRHRIPLTPEVEEQLYRIGVEALNNAAKHARPTAVTVLVKDESNAVRLVISDDGRGFDPSIPHPGHLGLRTMVDRAEAIGAAINVSSKPGVGTAVEVTAALMSAE